MPSQAQVESASFPEMGLRDGGDLGASSLGARNRLGARRKHGPQQSHPDGRHRHGLCLADVRGPGGRAFHGGLRRAQERRDAAKAYVEERQGRGTCAAYNDFREVIERDDVDAVYIATPDHWHALVTIAAARAGKHVYCQKPLSRTIAEGRAVVAAVQRHGIVFQHGTQQRHDARMLFGCELVRNGYIGQLQHVKIGSPAGLTCPPQPPQPVPPGLDWEMWLGPAPWAPFTPLRIESHPWYHISDYSLGYIAGWGVHHADSAMQGSGLDDYAGPVEIDARGTFPSEGLFDNPYRWNMDYRFANGVTWNWTDTPSWEPSKDWSDPVRHPMGIRFEGTEGWVFIWRGEVDAHPKKLLRVRIGPRDKVRLRENLPGDFIDCVRQGRRTCARSRSPIARRTSARSPRSACCWAGS